MLENGCRCVEIDVWNGESPPSSEDEGEGEESRIKSLRNRIGKNLHLRHHDKEEPNHQVAEQPHSAPAGNLADERVKPWRIARCEPRVLHGHTATKEVSFRSVCEAIGKSAFKARCDKFIGDYVSMTDSIQQYARDCQSRNSHGCGTTTNDGGYHAGMLGPLSCGERHQC